MPAIPRSCLTPTPPPLRAQTQCIKLHQNTAQMNQKPHFPLPTLPSAPGVKRTQFFLASWLHGYLAFSFNPHHAKPRQTTPKRPKPRHQSRRAEQTAMTAALSRGVFFIFTTRDSSSAVKCSLTAAAPVFFTFRQWSLVDPLRICRANSPAPQALKRARSFQTAIRGVCS